MSATVGQILEVLGALAPWDLCEEWDNSGLQVGDVNRDVKKVVVGLDAGEEEISCALGKKAQLLVTHHPLLLHPLKNIDLGNLCGILLAKAVKGELAVVSVHTNLDAASGGLADKMAEKLHLSSLKILEPIPAEGYMKLVVYLPEDHVDSLIDSLKEAGAGKIGRYEECFFTSGGFGIFTPGEGAEPYIGKIHKQEKVKEIKLEVRIQRRQIDKVIEAIKKVHPYEEPAVDLYPLHGVEEGVGFGRVGDRAISTADLIKEVKNAFNCKYVRVFGRQPKLIRRVAVIPGSGGGFIQAASSTGADVMVTGEIKYHQALEATSLGLLVIESGHRATEADAVPLMAGYLRKRSGDKDWGLTVEECEIGGNVFITA